MQLYTEH